MRNAVRRVLRKHGDPPDKQDRAVETVIEQAELLSEEVGEQSRLGNMFGLHLCGPPRVSHVCLSRKGTVIPAFIQELKETFDLTTFLWEDYSVSLQLKIQLGPRSSFMNLGRRIVVENCRLDHSVDELPSDLVGIQHKVL